MTPPREADALAPRATFLMRLAVDFHEPDVVDGGPAGQRRILRMREGSFTGPDLRGSILPGGADRVLRRPDGVFSLDIRVTLRTDQDELVHVTSTGLLDIADEVRERVRHGERVAASSYYFRTMLQFETGAARLRRLNRVLAIGIGTRTATGMSTDVSVLE